ncbi:MAG: hypothetical protein KAQ75_13740 [Bacteroidales bacterium]|nr:hypothetical protein [Bacteroidales bacterium]
MSIKKILFGILFVLVISGLIYIYIFFKPEKNLARVEPHYKLSAIELFNEYSLDEEAANHKFLGKVVEVSGKVREVNVGDTISTVVILETDDPFFGINCVLNQKYTSIQKEILSGNAITIKGVCSGKLLDVVLDNCVVIER